MKKSIILLFLMIIPLFFLSSCKSDDASKSSNLMTVDINPSVEFVLDEEQKVVSVTALNDDGAVIISGEIFVGLSATEAASKIVSISVETGFISQEDAKEIKLTISGDEIEAIYSDVKGKISDTISKLGINSNISQGKALTREQLENYILKSDSALTKKDVSALSNEELIKKLGEIRQEYAGFVTEDLRNAYNTFKESKISFAEKDEVKNIIESLGDAYTSILNSYNSVLDQLDTASQNLNDIYYNNFISEKSAYQEALSYLKDVRLKLVSIKNAKTIQELYNVLSSEQFSSFPEISTILSTLNIAIQLNMQESLQSTYETIHSSITTSLETMLSTAESALELAKSTAESAVAAVRETLESLKQQLEKLEKSFPEEIKTVLTNNATLIEENLNEIKDALLSDFEENYKETLENITAEFARQKQELKDAVNNK